MRKNKTLVIFSLMTGFPWGGSEQLWFDTALAGIRNGIDVHVWVKKWPEESNKIGVLREAGVIVNYYDLTVRVMGNWWQRLRGKEVFEPVDILAKVRSLAPKGILFSQGDTFSAFGNSIFDEVLLLEFPVFLLSQHLSDYENPSPLIRMKSKTGVHKIEKFFFVSQRSLNLTKRFLQTDGKNFVRVNNPVNIQNKELVEYPPDKTINFAVVARYDCRFKGQDVLLELLSHEKWKNRDWVCNLYGSGSDLDYLKELIRFYNLDQRVFIKGFENSVEKIWAENHLLILPSVSEGTPLSLAEAMICGRTAVVTDVGGNGELIKEGINGFIAEAPQLLYLDKALERAWNNQEKWEEFGLIAHQNAVVRYQDDAGMELFNLISEKQK